MWKDVWIGSALTAVLFVLGKFILAFYLGSGAAGSAYGAASSLITLLLWIYYAAQILLLWGRIHPGLRELPTAAWWNQKSTP